MLLWKYETLNFTHDLDTFSFYLNNNHTILQIEIIYKINNHISCALEIKNTNTSSPYSTRSALNLEQNCWAPLYGVLNIIILRVVMLHSVFFNLVNDTLSQVILHIFLVCFLLFLAPAGGSNPSGPYSQPCRALPFLYIT